MNDIQFMIFSLTIIIIGIGIIISFKNEIHILTPLAMLGGGLLIITGFMFLIGCLVNLN